MPNPRSDYSNIFDRTPLKLPGGARVAVWPIINVEEWDINEPMARTVLRRTPRPQRDTRRSQLRLVRLRDACRVLAHEAGIGPARHPRHRQLKPRYARPTPTWCEESLSPDGIPCWPTATSNEC